VVFCAISRVAEFGERLQRGVGQLGPPLGELVDLPPRHPFPVRLAHDGLTGHVGHSSDLPDPFRGRSRPASPNPLYRGKPSPPRMKLDNCPRKS
jgi:hypothetical protein